MNNKSDNKSIKRIYITLSHIVPTNKNNIETNQCSSHDFDIKNEKMKWNGWGFRDTEFKLNDKGLAELTGSRYDVSGSTFPSFREWAESKLGLDTNDVSFPVETIKKIPEPITNNEFLESIKGSYKRISFDAYTRVFHSHGHTMEEIFELRNGFVKRIPDVVVWPGDHEQVEKLVKEAVKHNVCIIPYGGGTTVTYAVRAPENEKRMIVCVAMQEMNKIKWIDNESMMALIEAGAVGIDLDKRLRAKGYTIGHEPDSFEFSTLGGWISTRASGMKKNTYGNIEDIIVHVKIVTPSGTLQKSVQVPRISSGPDLHHFILGSEGMFGIITEAVVRVRKIPPVLEYGSIIFPNFELGVSALREVTRQRIFPSSIRLVDNMQFQFGQTLKPEVHSRFEKFMDTVKKFYVTKLMKFDVDKMVAATLVFEGDKEEVEYQKKKIYSIAAQFHGVKAGAENGKRGYFLTYMIAYLRDYALNYYYIAESFETSVPWSNVHQLISGVKKKLIQISKEKGVTKEPFISARVTQLYETGCAVYFYYGFHYKGISDPVRTFEEIEDAARDEILLHGGSISHHHGIGKIRKKWVKETISQTGVDLLSSIKKSIDPNNIFCVNNIIPN
eukprot:TRINITY_DN8619_c0_g1_i1.p1 TRINITY_DN8619_c0_g1~~TRINITY_DN8619_c0_g1_i1.p1  ORF type:complete len:613 (-),score=168.47 TRINITY_DN8619_c0_g1_i1:74-1912(-)